MGGHEHLVLKQNAEQLLSEDGKVLLLKKLRVNLTELVELRIDLILRNGTLVTN